MIMRFFKRRSLILPQSSELFDQKNQKKVSFCITHKNRNKYLKNTLAKNLEDNREDQEILEFVLIDFASEEELKPWLIENFEKDIKSGFLKFFYSEDLKEWDASLAKNTSHFLSSGTIVVNLDCDNFTGIRGGKHVFDTFLKNESDIIFWQHSKKSEGSFGRIASTKAAFNEIGGYNEEFLPMGFQDGDLRNRLIASGRKLVHDKNQTYNKAIKNEKYKPANMTWKSMNEHNQKISKKNIKDKKLIANNGKYGIRHGILQLSPITLQLESIDRPLSNI